MVGDENLIKEYATSQKTRDWGWTSVKNLRFVLPQVRTLSPSSVIDYGCGTSPLLQLLDVESIKERRHYDPAVADYSASPTKQYDLLISIDVLEHIDELHLDEVLDHMVDHCKEALIVVDTKAAALHKKTDATLTSVCMIIIGGKIAWNNISAR